MTHKRATHEKHIAHLSPNKIFNYTQRYAKTEHAFLPEVIIHTVVIVFCQILFGCFYFSILVLFLQESFTNIWIIIWMFIVHSRNDVHSTESYSRGRRCVGKSPPMHGSATVVWNYLDYVETTVVWEHCSLQASGFMQLFGCNHQKKLQNYIFFWK